MGCSMLHHYLLRVETDAAAGSCNDAHGVITEVNQMVKDARLMLSEFSP